jgi:putative addiction module killer protein
VDHVVFAVAHVTPLSAARPCQAAAPSNATDRHGTTVQPVDRLAPCFNPPLAWTYPEGYIAAVNTLLRSDEFDAWLAALKDAVGRARILARLRAAEAGNFGDCQPVGEGVSEMRIHTGPGYRLYYMQYRRVVYLLLSGGDKSTQKRDIKRAIRMARTVKEEGLS